MMHTTAARQAPEATSSFALRSIAPNRMERKNPLRRKKRAMLTGLFTTLGYQNGPSAETWRGGHAEEERNRKLLLGSCNKIRSQRLRQPYRSQLENPLMHDCGRREHILEQTLGGLEAAAIVSRVPGPMGLVENSPDIPGSAHRVLQ
ncbi:MAG: hypothetical protein JW990_16925 [Thermoleophilia bacterium]|nr:hypothetical protein [Thermoleophilia bacterium]